MPGYGRSLGSSRDGGGRIRAIEEWCRKLDLGPFRFFYSRENDVLQLQVWQQGRNYYKAIIEIDRDGKIRSGDAVQQHQSLEDYGRT